MATPFRLGPWTVDPRVGELTQPDHPPVRLRARVMELLAYLAEHPSEVLTKEHLLTAVWRTEAISESALTRTITELRQALGDDVDHPTFLETIPKRGYRLIAPVLPAEPPMIRLRSLEGDESVDSFPALTPTVSSATFAARAPVRSRRALLAASVGLVIGGTAVWQVRLLLRSGSPPRVQFAEREWVLVTAFDNRTGDPDFDATLEHALEHELSNSAYVNVAPRERVEDSLRLMVRPVTTRVDAAIGREVALRDGGIRLVIGGTIDRVGSTYAMTVQVSAPRDGMILASRREEVAADAQMAPTIQRLSNWIRTTLGESLPVTAGSAEALERATTPSLRALRLYSEGFAAFSRAYSQTQLTDTPRYEESEALFAAALDEDPDFASAHHWMAWTLRNQAKRHADYKRYANRAAELADRASVRERYFILGSYYELTGDTAAAIGSFEALLRLYPDDLWGLYKLERLYDSVAKHADAAEVVLRASAIRPNDFELVARAASESLWQRGLSAARPIVARAHRLLLDNPGTVHQDSAYAVLHATFVRRFPMHDAWVHHRVADALHMLDAEEPIDGESTSALAHFQRASFYLSFGQIKRAEIESSHIPDVPWRTLSQAIVAFAADNRTAVKDVLASYQGRDPLAVVLLARSGHIAAARSVLAHPVFDGDRHRGAILAEIAMASNSRVIDEAALRSIVTTIHRGGARRYLHSETLAELLVKQGRLNEATRVLEDTRAGAEATFNLVGHTGYFWMRAQLRLADLHRQAGRVSDARAIEKDLIAALSHADADYPMIVELKRRK